MENFTDLRQPSCVLPEARITLEQLLAERSEGSYPVLQNQFRGRGCSLDLSLRRIPLEESQGGCGWLLEGFPLEGELALVHCL